MSASRIPGETLVCANRERVLHIGTDNKNKGGAYIITRRAEERIRSYGYSFDYLSMDEFDAEDDSETALLPDSKTYAAHLRQNSVIGFVKMPGYIRSVLRESPYRIVHIDVDLAWKALLYAVPAKLSGSKVVVHSHSTGIDGDHRFLKGLAHRTCRHLLSVFADGYLACSQNAAKWMFPKHLWKDVVVLPNGTDLEHFHFDETVRRQWREKLGVSQQFVIGNIGVLSDLKNQLFLVDLAGYLHEQHMDVLLLIIGKYTPEWEEKIRNAAMKNNIPDRVILYGYSTQTCELLNAMDLYICPSKVEGFSLTLCEAQATGLPCIRSEAVPDEAVISAWTEQVDLRMQLDDWSKAVKKLAERFKDNRNLRKVKADYGLEKMAEKLEQFYSQLREK